MFIHQIPGSNWGIISIPGVVTLSHSPFPILPIDWMHELKLAYFPLLCTMCDVLETLKQREFGWTCFIDIHNLKQLRALLGLQQREWKEEILGFFSP